MPVSQNVDDHHKVLCLNGSWVNVNVCISDTFFKATKLRVFIVIRVEKSGVWNGEQWVCTDIQHITNLKLERHKVAFLRGKKHIKTKLSTN